MSMSLGIGGCHMEARGNLKMDSLPKRDAYDVVKQFLIDVSAGRVAKSKVHEIRTEVYTVAARLKRVQQLFPQADLGLSEGFRELLQLLERRHGFLGRAALF